MEDYKQFFETYSMTTEEKKTDKLCPKCKVVKSLATDYYRAGPVWQSSCKIWHQRYGTLELRGESDRLV